MDPFAIERSSVLASLECQNDVVIPDHRKRSSVDETFSGLLIKRLKTAYDGIVKDERLDEALTIDFDQVASRFETTDVSSSFVSGGHQWTDFLVHLASGDESTIVEVDEGFHLNDSLALKFLDDSDSPTEDFSSCNHSLAGMMDSEESRKAVKPPSSQCINLSFCEEPMIQAYCPQSSFDSLGKENKTVTPIALRSDCTATRVTTLCHQQLESVTPIPCACPLLPSFGAISDGDIPMLKTLTSFPFRIVHANNACKLLTGRSDLIGSTFYDLFVHESQNTPPMSDCNSVFERFQNDIVKVHRKNTKSNVREGQNSEENYVYCQINVKLLPGIGATMFTKSESAVVQNVTISLLPILQPPRNEQGFPCMIYLPMPLNNNAATTRC